MQNLSGPDRTDSGQEPHGHEPTIFYFVFRDVNDYDSDRKIAQVVFVLKSLVGGKEDIEVRCNLGQENMIPKVLPAKVKRCRDFMAGNNLGRSRINAGVYKDAHDNCSMVSACPSSRRVCT